MCLRIDVRCVVDVLMCCCAAVMDCGDLLEGGSFGEAVSSLCGDVEHARLGSRPLGIEMGR